jgi:hypothetical protein
MCLKTIKLKVISEKILRERTFVVFCSRSTAHFFVPSLLFGTACSVDKASTVFTTNTRGLRRSLMVSSVLDTINRSALICGQGLLVIVC